MKPTLAIFAALPFVAQADPEIDTHANKLYVQYEGVVVPGSAPLRDGYNVGDSVAGTLLIDTLRAPPTNVQPENGFAYYAWPGPRGVDFVTGWVTNNEEPRDFVMLDRGRGPNLGSNSYGIADANRNRSLYLFAISPEIRSLDLVQTLDIEQEDEHGGMLGFFEWGRGAVEQVVFRMTRFSVTPGRCRP